MFGSALSAAASVPSSNTRPHGSGVLRKPWSDDQLRRTLCLVASVRRRGIVERSIAGA
jgi:hypothetical protein